MTEKNYGGTTDYGTKSNLLRNSNKTVSIKGNEIKKVNTKDENDNSKMIEEEKYIKAGKIASETVKFSKSFIKPGMSLLEIAEKIELKICELGGKPAFPVNLSINEVAAHSTPTFNDTTKAFGLLKVDLGAHIDGCIADTALSLDLENNTENKALIETAELALSNAIALVKNSKEVNLGEIGLSIEKVMKSRGFTPIQNLTGHSIEKYNLHSGITIPNFNNGSTKILSEGVYAIEPFSTNGLGSVRDGKPSSIFHLEKPGNVRDNFARKVLNFILEEYQTLPFCSRWIYKKFGSRGLLALRQIEQAGLLYQYPQLIERGNGKVAQAEHTIIITEKEKIISTI